MNKSRVDDRAFSVTQKFNVMHWLEIKNECINRLDIVCSLK